MDFSEFDDAELLELIGQRDFDEATAKQAAVVFYERHMPWFFGKCTELRFRILGGDAENFAREVFASIYHEKAAKFSRQENQNGTAEQMVRAWLTTIANNCLADQHRRRFGVDEELFNDWIQRSERNQDNEPSKDAQRVAAMLNDLSERDRFIVTTYSEWTVDGRKIPPKVLKTLAVECQMTTEGVRKVYYRFRERVKESIETDSAIQQVR